MGLWSWNKTEPMSIYEFKESKSRIWLKVFFHDSSNNEFFNKSEAHYNVGNPHKFSILQNIHLFVPKVNDYEFLLEYPELQGLMHWKQRANPMELTEEAAVNHFECIQCTWDTYFQGLFLSPNQNTLLEGDKRKAGYWRFAIGAYHAYIDLLKFPGPATEPDNGISVTQARLWMKVGFITKQNICSRFSTRHTSLFLFYLFTKQS